MYICLVIYYVYVHALNPLKLNLVRLAPLLKQLKEKQNAAVMISLFSLYWREFCQEKLLFAIEY